MKKSLLSILMIVVMIVGIMPSSVLVRAADTNSTPTGEYGNFIDGEHLIDDMIEKNGMNAHPRIIMTEQKFEKLKSHLENGSIKEDGSVTAALLKEFKAEADMYLRDTHISTYDDYNGNHLETAKRIQRYVATLAMAYNIFGDEKYAKRAYAELEAACGFKDWNPYHFLDPAEMSTAFAFGYDWLYHWMDEDKRALLRKNIIEKSLMQIKNDYTGNVQYSSKLKDETDRSYTWYKSQLGDNWTFVCTGGTNLAALAIGDEEDAKDIAAEILTYGYQKAYSAIRQGYRATDGTYIEGLGYWDYATYYVGLQSSALKSATGQDYGLTDYDGIRKSVDFVRYMSSNYPYSFSFGDDGDSRDTGWPVFLWLGEHFGSPDLSAIRLRKIEEDKEFRFLDMLWIDESQQTGSELSNDTDWGSVGASNASFRNTWDINGTVAALHSGENNYLYHGHFDLGSFYIESEGARFFTDLGNETYDLTDRKYSYRIKPEGHNTLVINPSSDTDQRDGAICQITEFNAGDEAYAVTDLTDAYGDNGAKSVVRGLKMIKNKECVVIQDEISLNTAGEIYWFAHTKGSIDVASDGRSAVVTVLTKDAITKENVAHKLWIGLMSEGGKFTVMDAKPLSTSKSVAGVKDNSEYRKLAIHLTNTKDTTISVACIPLKNGVSSPAWTPSVKAISEWAGASPSTSPSVKPSTSPSVSASPSTSPSVKPSTSPSVSASPSTSPSVKPSAQPSTTISVHVEVPGKEPVTLEMQKTDYIGTVKYKLQNQMDIDLNRMDLIYNDKILSEVNRFSSGLVPDGATIKMQPSNRWNYDEVTGVEDKTFSIARPKEESLKKIYAKDYGMSPENADNTAAFKKALKDCTANAYLVIEQGTYYFRNMTDDIAFNNMENVIIDGNNSTFIFDTKYCMKIYGGNGIEFRNLKVNWDWDKIPVGSLVQIDKKHSNNVFDIRFIGVDEVDEDIPIGTFMYLDPDDLTVGSYGKYKAYTPGSVSGCLQNVEKVDHNVLRITHNGDMRHFNEGEYYLLRHFEYSGRVFSTGRYAKNITYDNVSIYGFTGMGWVFGDKANHFQIIHSYLGLDPDGPRERRISTAADAIHILNTGGYFRIADCDLGFTGDDIINVHDDMMVILEIDESRTILRGWATSGLVEAGDILRFRNHQQKEFTEYEAKVTSFRTLNGYEREVVLAEPLPQEITSDCFVYSKSHSSSNYVIAGNYIHEARARASLLNDDYGLFENNYVYRCGGIEVCSSYEPGRWFEGEGACHIVARNNTFEECDNGGPGTAVKINVKIAGKDSTEQILNDILIENNVFINCKYREDKVQNLMEINNVNNLVVSGNVIENCGEIKLGDVIGTTTIEDNHPHTEHTFVNGVCTVCNEIWEKEIDGITYRAITEVEKRRPIAVTTSDGEVALSVVKVSDVAGKAVVLPEEVTDHITGQKFILTSIEKNVFVNSEATSITIPKTVTEIGDNAFGDIEIIVEDDEPSVSPSPSEDVSISPSPSSVPSENPSESPSTSPVPSKEASTSPSPSEVVSVSPSPSSVPSEAPSDAPSTSPVPSKETSTSPFPSEVVSVSPSPSSVPSEAPSEVPSTSPAPSEDISTSPVPSEDISTSPVPSEEVSVSPSPGEKQTITVAKKMKKTVSLKASVLKKKKVTLKLKAKANTKLSYKVKKYPKKAKRYISVSKKGIITLKKGAKKGTYKVVIIANADSKYAKATKTITIKVK